MPRHIEEDKFGGQIFEDGAVPLGFHHKSVPQDGVLQGFGVDATGKAQPPLQPGDKQAALVGQVGGQLLLDGFELPQ